MSEEKIECIISVGVDAWVGGFRKQFTSFLEYLARVKTLCNVERFDGSMAGDELSCPTVSNSRIGASPSGRLLHALGELCSSIRVGLRLIPSKPRLHSPFLM